MHDTCVTHLIAIAIFASGFTATYFKAHAQGTDIQTVYATQKGACGRDPRNRIVISKGRITGPGFDCTLSTMHPAGTGLAAYDATCTIDGKKTSKGITLDLGNYRDHFELSLPGRKNWIALYPCTPVPGLN